MTEPNTEPTQVLTVETRPEVRDFVRAVRARLSDLTEEERTPPRFAAPVVR